MTPGELERLRRLENIVIRARESGQADLLARAAGILGDIIRLNHPEPDHGNVRADSAEPHDARAHARTSDPGEPDERQLDGLHKLRKGRDQCGATRRDGGQCQAPAIRGGLVCHRHGGAAPQVAIAAEYTENLTRANSVRLEYEEARGTPGEFDALCRLNQTATDLEAYQIKLRLLRELKAARRQRTAEPI